MSDGAYTLDVEGELMDAQKVGKAIKVLRNRIGYTQHNLADSLGVTDKAVSKWERGLSVPDIAIITQLSLILNCDVDNLLEGNITFLERTWQGLLIMEELPEQIFSGTIIYGKPLVYIFLSYFMLAGIRDISILCQQHDKEFIGQKIDESKLGINISYIDSIENLNHLNTMVVYGNPFVYGPNLTKYFQRAMAKCNRITAMSVYKKKGAKHCSIDFNNQKVVKISDIGKYYYIPIVFVSESCFADLPTVLHLEKLIERHQLYTEPMGNGMIEYSIKTKEDVTNIPRFHIMFAGPVTPNPTELLSGERFQRMLESFREIYDYIIIDAAPLGLVVDAAIIAKQCDGSILVIESEAIKYRLAQDVKHKLESSGCPILGAVLNKVDRKSGGRYYGKYYGKYYGHYYGHSEDHEEEYDDVL